MIGTQQAGQRVVSGKGDSRSVLLTIGGMALLVFAVYRNTLGHPFLMDDFTAILGHRGIRFGDGIALGSRWLVEWTFRLNVLGLGLTPASFRLVNVAIHVINVVLLFGIVRILLEPTDEPGRRLSRSDLSAAWIALAWGLHPLHTGSVIYICQRYELLMGSCFLLAFFCYLRGLTGTRPRFWFDLSLVAGLLGMATKEVMAVAPLVIVIFDWIMGERLSGRPFRSRIRLHIAWGLLMAAGVCLWFSAWGHALDRGGYASPLHTVWEYARTQPGVIAHYIRLSMIPYPLVFDYCWPIENRLWMIVIQGAGIGLLAVASACGVVKRQPAAMLGVWFFGILLPTSSVVVVQDPAFEHRLYLPLAAVMMALGSLGRWGYVHGRGMRPILAGGAVAYLILMGGLTVYRGMDYESAVRLWGDTVEKRPDNGRARINLAMACYEAEDYPSALFHAWTILESGAPDERFTTYIHARAHTLAGNVWLAQDRAMMAVLHYRLSLEMWQTPSTRLNLAMALAQSEQYDKARQVLRDALYEDPSQARAWALNGYLAMMEGDFHSALRWYQRAKRMDGRFLPAQADLAMLLASVPDADLLDPDRALALCDALNRAFQEPSIRLLDIQGMAWAAKGDFNRAIQCAEDAVVLRKTRGMDPDPHLNLRLDRYREGIPYRFKRTPGNPGMSFSAPGISATVPYRP